MDMSLGNSQLILWGNEGLIRGEDHGQLFGPRKICGEQRWACDSRYSVKSPSWVYI